MGPHVLTYVPNGFVQLATLTTLVPPLTDMDFHVFLQQVTGQKLLLAKCALKGLVACKEKGCTEKQTITFIQVWSQQSTACSEAVSYHWELWTYLNGL